MKNNLFKYELISTFFILTLGTLLHFTYNGTLITSIFSSINESTWEHLKLIFFPMIITSIIGTYYYGKKYLCIKTKYIIYAIGTMIIFFYTYTGIIGKNNTIIDILSYYIIIITYQIISYKKINTQCNKLYIILNIILFILFIIFTYYPPHINLFKDPVYNNYEIKKIIQNV